jgi:hypothetical protein
MDLQSAINKILALAEKIRKEAEGNIQYSQGVVDGLKMLVEEINNAPRQDDAGTDQ